MADARQLAPMAQPVGMFDAFIARQSETFILREKAWSLSGDSFEIKLRNGQPLIQVKGSVMSWSGRKTVTDMAGNHLFDICQEYLHWHTTYVLKSPDDVTKLMEVKSKFARECGLPDLTFVCDHGRAVGADETRPQSSAPSLPPPSSTPRAARSA